MVSTFVFCSSATGSAGALLFSVLELEEPRDRAKRPTSTTTAPAAAAGICHAGRASVFFGATVVVLLFVPVVRVGAMRARCSADSGFNSAVSAAVATAGASTVSGCGAGFSAQPAQIHPNSLTFLARDSVISASAIRSPHVSQKSRIMGCPKPHAGAAGWYSTPLCRMDRIFFGPAAGASEKDGVGRRGRDCDSIREGVALWWGKGVGSWAKFLGKMGKIWEAVGVFARCGVS